MKYWAMALRMVTHRVTVPGGHSVQETSDPYPENGHEVVEAGDAT
jgi:hypothetical protein